MKKINLLYLVTILATSSILYGCNKTETSNDISSEEDIDIETLPSNGYDGTIGHIHFSLPDLGTNVGIHTDLQKNYLSDEDYSNIASYVNAKVNLDTPKEIIFMCGVEGNNTNEFKISISEKPNMEDSIVYENTSTFFKINNFKLDTKYYWTFTADEITSKVASFRTVAGAPRSIKIDGLANIRDIGGWETTNGFVVNQGLFYRCAALTQNVNGKNIVTEKGINQLNEQLHIKSEIDLRGATVDENGNLEASVIGENVNYYHCPMGYGDLLQSNKEQVKRVFELLADINNYPLVLHCAGGIDRTGMIAYLVNSLCFVKEENLYRDYLYSDFAKTNDMRAMANMYSLDYYKLINNLKTNNKMSHFSATYKVLTDMGIESETLDRVMEIMIKDYVAD